MEKFIRNADEFKINPSDNLLSAIDLLNKVKPKVLLVVNKGKVLGTISDGDIRRGILDGKDLYEPCSKVMKTDFRSLQINELGSIDLERLKSTFKGLSLIPLLEGEILKSIFVYQDFESAKISSIGNVVGLVMAGGFGSRMGNLTKNKPKALLEVNGLPMIEHIIQQFAASGVKKIYVSTFYLKDKIIDRLGSGGTLNVEISYLEEEEPLGTAGALRLLDPKSFNNVLVSNCDVITELNLINFLGFHQERESIATMAIKEHFITNPFGVVEFENTYFMKTTEKPMYKSYINAGIYILNSEALKFVGDSGKIDMPMIFERLRKSNYKPHVFPIHERWDDIGTPIELGKINKDLSFG